MDNHRPKPTIKLHRILLGFQLSHDFAYSLLDWNALF